MPRRTHGLLGFALLVTLGGGAAAQQTTNMKPVQIPNPSGGQTPPVAPKTVESKVPPTVAIPPVPPTADVVNRPLTADESVLIALHKQPNVEIARAGIAAAQGVTEQTRSALLPNLALSAGYNNVTVITGAGAGGSSGPSGTATGSSSGFTGSAALHQLIFDFNHTRELVRQTEALTHAAEQNLTKVQSDLVSQVKQAYYLVVADDQLVVVNQENLDNRLSQLKLATARLNSGLGLPSDVATAETAYSAGIITLNLAQNNAAIARVNLALLMGIDARTPFTTVAGGEPTFPSNDVNALVDQALKQRPDVLQAQANVDANRHGVSAARTTNAPVVAGTLSFDSRGDSFLPGDNGLTVGASVTFTPFDGGLTQGKVKEARANLDSAQASLLSARQTVVSDVAQAWLNLRTAEQRIATANEEVTNAAEGVRIATGRYTAGLGLFQDIITAQGFLVTARTDVVNAQAQVDTSRAALRHAIGLPPPVVH